MEYYNVYCGPSVVTDERIIMCVFVCSRAYVPACACTSVCVWVSGGLKKGHCSLCLNTTKCSVRVAFKAIATTC